MVFRTTSGEERRVRLSAVGRLYLGRYPGGRGRQDDHGGYGNARAGGR